MFILEEPYVSDLLVATVAELGLPVLDTPMARERLAGVAADLIVAEQTAGRTTALIVADLPASVDVKAIASVDYDRFATQFSCVRELRPTDFNRYPVFAFTFVEVPSDDLRELHSVLGVDLSEYVRMSDSAESAG